MLHFSGVVQLAAINKEDVSKNGDKIVYFTAFTRRGDKSDRLFFKVFGRTAEYLIRNLVKKADGSYKSRKIYVAGGLETYETTKSESLPPKEFTPQELPPQYGVLNQPIALIFTREAKETTFCFKVSYLEFEDKKKETEPIEVYRSSADNVYSPQGIQQADTHYQPTQGSLMSTIKEVNNNLDNLVEPDLNGII